MLSFNYDGLVSSLTGCGGATLSHYYNLVSSYCIIYFFHHPFVHTLHTLEHLTHQQNGLQQMKMVLLKEKFLLPEKMEGV